MKAKQARAKFQHKMDVDDYVIAFFDSSKIMISSKIIKKFFHKLITESRVESNKEIFLKLTDLYKKSAEWIHKTDKTFITKYLMKIIVTEDEFQAIYDFFKLFSSGSLVYEGIEEENMSFFLKNFKNYYIYKKLTDNYSFDLSIQINEIDKNDMPKVVELFNVIIQRNHGDDNLHQYILKYKTNDNFKPCVLFYFMIEAFYMNVDQKNIESEGTDFFDSLVYEFLCFSNKDEDNCKICIKKIYLTDKLAEIHKDRIFIRLVQLIQQFSNNRNIEKLIFLIKHTTLARNTQVFQIITKAYFRNHYFTKEIIDTFNLFDCKENTDIEQNICEMLIYNRLNPSNEQLVKILDIIAHIQLTKKMTLTLFLSTINCFLTTKNKHIKIHIKAWNHKRMNDFHFHFVDILKSYFDFLSVKQLNINEKIEIITDFFCDSVDEFIIKNKFLLAPILFRRNCDYVSVFERESHYIPYIIADMIRKDDIDAYWKDMDYSKVNILEIYGVRIFISLIIQEKTAFSKFIGFFEISNSDFFKSKLIEILFFLKNMYRENALKLPRCVFMILTDILKITQEETIASVDVILPYIEYFSEFKEGLLHCKKIHEDPSQCQEYLIKCIMAINSTKQQKDYGFFSNYIKLQQKESIQTFSELLELSTEILSSKTKIFRKQILISINTRFYEIVTKILKSENFNLSPGFSMDENTIAYTCLTFIYPQLTERDFLNIDKICHIFYTDNKEQFISFLITSRILFHRISLFQSNNTDSVYNLNINNVEILAVYLLETHLLNFDNETQDVYFFVIQETLKSIENISLMGNDSKNIVNYFQKSHYFMEIDLSSNAKGSDLLKTQFKEYINGIYTMLIKMLHSEKNLAFFELFKLGYLLKTSVKELYTLYMVRYIISNKINDLKSFNKLLDDTDISMIEIRIQKHLLKLHVMSYYTILSTENVVNLAYNTNNYHIIIRLLENNYKVLSRGKVLLLYSYFKVGDFDSIYDFLSMNDLCIELYLFFTLCIDRFLSEAEDLISKMKNLTNEEKEVLNKLLKDELNEEIDIIDVNELLNLNSNAFENLSIWNINKSEEKHYKTCHILYDIKLLNETNNPEFALNLIEERREIMEYDNYIIQKHKSIGYALQKTQENEISFQKIDVTEKKENNRIELFKQKVCFEEMDFNRKQNNLEICKKMINEQLLRKNWSALYSLASINFSSGKLYEARSNLNRFFKNSSVDYFIHEKSTLLYAKILKSADYYEEAYKLYQDSEKLLFFRGKFYENKDCLLSLQSYIRSVDCGSKYASEAIPRIIHIFSEKRLQNQKNLNNKLKVIQENCDKIFASFIEKADLKLFFPRINDILSKICHPDDVVCKSFSSLVKSLLQKHPHKICWNILIFYNSIDKNLQKTTHKIIHSLSSSSQSIFTCYLKASIFFSKVSQIPAKNCKVISLSKIEKPSQSFLNFVQIPHIDCEVFIDQIKDEVHVFKSLQAPKRLVIIGKDGKEYGIICKSNDDLRKDNRFMDINILLNHIFSHKMQKKTQRLYIRVYKVVPITHKNGIIQSIDNLKSLNEILRPMYAERKLFVTEVQRKYSETQKIGIANFSEIVKKFPPIFNEWFKQELDPLIWYQKRNNFINTYCAMCIVGWFMGLGDRHLENILIDTNTGDALHVDLNAIFNVAQKMRIPEKVPFRLTQNIVDLFGESKTDGKCRKIMERCLEVMVEHKDLIVSNLLSFVYDPLFEWSAGKINKHNSAIDIINNLSNRLEPQSISETVGNLIKEATDDQNLASIFIGWASFI